MWRPRLLGASQVLLTDALALQCRADLGERAAHAIVYRLGIGPSDERSDSRGGQLLEHEQLHRHLGVGGKGAQRLDDACIALGWRLGLALGDVLDGERKRPRQVSGQEASAPRTQGAVGRREVLEEFGEGEAGLIATDENLVGLYVGAIPQEHELADAPLPVWQRLRRGAELLATVAMAEPVDDEISQDGNEPGRE